MMGREKAFMLAGDDVSTAAPALPQRRLEAADVPAAQALTAGFGWPHRQQDWAMMQALGDGVTVSAQGRVLGVAMCWRFGPDWATMGLIAVDAASQGQGIGRQMLRALIDSLGSRSILLHATQAGLRLYAELGWKPAGTTLQHQGTASPMAPMPLPPGTRLRPAGLADLADLASLDHVACGMDRTALLRVLLALPGGVVLDGQRGAEGFALVRAFGRGQLVGPMIAADDAAARAMAAHLLSQRTGQFVRLDVPEESGLGPWLASLGLEKVGTATRMVHGPDAANGLLHVFGLASQAWG